MRRDVEKLQVDSAVLTKERNEAVGQVFWKTFFLSSFQLIWFNIDWKRAKRSGKVGKWEARTVQQNWCSWEAAKYEDCHIWHVQKSGRSQYEIEIGDGKCKNRKWKAFKV